MLYTSGTPHGRKISIFLEELKVMVQKHYNTDSDTLFVNSRQPMAWNTSAPSLAMDKYIVLIALKVPEDRPVQEHSQGTVVHRTQPEWPDSRYRGPREQRFHRFRDRCHTAVP
jgi:hypothetical protein